MLQVNDLHVSFDGEDGIARVLKRVSLEIQANEIVGLVGESGSGKSVTARTILGTLPMPPGRIDSGEMYFDGTDLVSLDPPERAGYWGTEFSLIPQEPQSSLNPVFTVGDQLRNLIRWGGRTDVSLAEYFIDRFRRSGRTETRDQAIELLEDVQIPDPEGILDRYPIELSGGMAQRVLIAMALAGNPSLLVADEPTTALDVTTTQEILTLLEKNCEKHNMSVLFITHDLGIARQLCDRIYVMYGGQIAETGTPEQLFNDPKHPYTKALLTAIPDLTRGVGDGVSGDVPDYTSPPTGCRFHPRCPEAMSECARAEPELTTLEVGSPVTADTPNQASMDDESKTTAEPEHACACFLHEVDGIPVDGSVDISNSGETKHHE